MVLKPGELYLAQTMEHTVTKNLVPVISGRSSIGRLGINVHATAGFGDVGFSGYWTLELFVVRPVIVYAGMQIAQIYYHTIQGQVEEYKGKYMKNEGVQPSMIWKEFKE
jgi:dCTP deaminase